MTTTALVPLDQYLATSYSPDVEYIDGELRAKTKEAAVVQWKHSNSAIRHQRLVL